MNEQQYYNPNMYQQPYYGTFNNGVMNGGGVIPNMMYNPTPQSSTLTPEEFEFLNKNKAGFSLNATQEEITAALCNHVNQNHTSALIMDDDGNGNTSNRSLHHLSVVMGCHSHDGAARV